MRCFLPSVCFKMPYKINIQQYRLVTLVTLVWFLPSMSPHIYFNEMFFRHYASSYGLLNYLSLQNPCHIALIWILPRMFFEMTCKIIIPWRGLVTLTEVICIFIWNVFCFFPNAFSNYLYSYYSLKKVSHIDLINMFFWSECSSNISKIRIC